MDYLNQHPIASKAIEKLATYPKQHFHIRVTLDADRIQVDNTLLLQLVGVSVHVQIRPGIRNDPRE